MESGKPHRAKEGLPLVHPNAAGIDIGSRSHVVAVPAHSDPEPVRTFATFTGDLHAMAAWLKAAGVTTVAMESTSVYWIPAFEILEASGFEVILVNARDAKQVPGRKTDVNDAQWLQKLHAYGLHRASFRPHQQIVALRSYVRQRERLLEMSSMHILHMQKALMEMNVQLHHVVADITGATGLRIVRAIIAGERDPAQLALLRDRQCKNPVETIEAALHGHYRDEHVFALTQAVHSYDFCHVQVAECGTDMTRWPSAKHLTSWLCLAPGNKISGGKLLSSRTRRSGSRAAAALRLAATTVGKTDTALGAFYRRLSARTGKAKAVTATARKIAVLFYNALRHGMQYQDPGASYYEERHRQRVLEGLRRRAASLGYALLQRPITANVVS